jgi:hypothetical protein
VTRSIRDTVVFRSVAVGTDGKPLHTALLSMCLAGSRMHSSAEPPVMLEVYEISKSPPPRNTLKARAVRAGTTYVSAQVVGFADSVSVRVIPGSRPSGDSLRQAAYSQKGRLAKR